MKRQTISLKLYVFGSNNSFTKQRGHPARLCPLALIPCISLHQIVLVTLLMLSSRSHRSASQQALAKTPCAPLRLILAPAPKKLCQRIFHTITTHTRSCVSTAVLILYHVFCFDKKNPKARKIRNSRDPPLASKPRQT